MEREKFWPKLEKGFNCVALWWMKAIYLIVSFAVVSAVSQLGMAGHITEQGKTALWGAAFLLGYIAIALEYKK
jgi:hypothetical protein